jgi:D-serine deaminase-like pyridoxal phosphate-dependent protein
VLPAEHIDVPAARLGLADAALAVGDRAAARTALAGLDAHPGLVASPGTSARWRTLVARAR